MSVESTIDVLKMSTFLLANRQLAHLASNTSRRSLSTTSSLAAAAEVKRLGVVGAGQMVSKERTPVGSWSSFRKLIQGDQGLGIALVAAQKARVPVTLVDTSQASLDKGMKFAGT